MVKRSPEENYIFIKKDMAKKGMHCPKCGLWLPKNELKKGIICPECGSYCKIK